MPDVETIAQALIASRAKIPRSNVDSVKSSEEGGCGVTGFISNIQIRGKHIFEPSVRMHNRGNGKGGGIAALGLCPEDLGVTQDILDTHYMLQIAILDRHVKSLVEEEYIEPLMDVNSCGQIPAVDDYRDVKGLEICPPDVQRYFVRVKKNVLDMKKDIGKFFGKRNCSL